MPENREIKGNAKSSKRRQSGATMRKADLKSLQRQVQSEDTLFQSRLDQPGVHAVDRLSVADGLYPVLRRIMFGLGDSRTPRRDALDALSNIVVDHLESVTVGAVNFAAVRGGVLDRDCFEAPMSHAPHVLEAADRASKDHTTGSIVRPEWTGVDEEEQDVSVSMSKVRRPAQQAATASYGVGSGQQHEHQPHRTPEGSGEQARGGAHGHRDGSAPTTTASSSSSGLGHGAATGSASMSGADQAPLAAGNAGSSSGSLAASKPGVRFSALQQSASAQGSAPNGPSHAAGAEQSPGPPAAKRPRTG